MGPTRKEGVQGGLGKPPSCQSHPERMWRSKVTTAQKGPQGWDTCARQQPFLNPPQHSQSSSLQLCSLLPTDSTSLFLGFPICTVGVTLAFAFLGSGKDQRRWHAEGSWAHEACALSVLAAVPNVTELGLPYPPAINTCPIALILSCLILWQLDTS